MDIYSERIKPTHFGIKSYLDDLKNKNYQIPTFQREVVWSANSVKKLWDSVFRFYPIGSILIWKTNLRLHNHRSIGGHIIANTDKSSNFNFILDGQQRTTSLLTSLFGGDIVSLPGFDPTLYVDLTIEDSEVNDNSVYKDRFLFWNEIDDRNGQVRRNTPRLEKYKKNLIFKLKDIMLNFGNVERKIMEAGYSDYDDPVRNRLRTVQDVLNNYRISFIELRGIEVSEVCQIFERINQEGEPLDIFDIVVAKTYRLSSNGQQGFYLRELIDEFRKNTPGFFTSIPDLWYLEMIAIIILRNIEETKIFNITPIYLNRIKTEYIEEVWPKAQVAIKKTFDLFENHLHLKGPRLIPFRYFFHLYVSYFYENDLANYDLLKKFFWYVSFHEEDLLRNTTLLLRLTKSLINSDRNGKTPFNTFTVNKHNLRIASYRSQSRLSTAILALFANQEPRDWSHTDKLVLNDVYYLITDKPNLHHIFPVNFIESHPGKNKVTVNSLMNIAYLPQITNLQISDDNPIDYFLEFNKPRFTEVLGTHLISPEILQWAEERRLPKDGLDQFIEKRLELVLDTLRSKLVGIPFDIIDTREEGNQ